MDSPPAVTPPPAARLSEEAMDLVCSFVREEEDDRVMAKTLCALALVSRRWTSSAVRALWHDPSRATAWRDEPLDFPNLLFRRPRMTVHIRSLIRLPELFFDRCEQMVHADDRIQSQNWFFGILRSCQKLSTMSMSFELPFEAIDEANPLTGVQHLVLQPDEITSTPTVEFAELLNNLKAGGLPDLQRLALRHFTCGLGENLTWTEPLFRLSTIVRLELRQYHACEGHLVDLLAPPNFPSLRHLCIETHIGVLSTLEYLPANLQSFACTSLGAGPEFPRSLFHSDGLPEVELRNSLTSFTFEDTFLCLSDLRRLSSAFPALTYLDLSESDWAVDEWKAPRYADAFDAFSTFLTNLPNLYFLSLGYLPLFSTPFGAPYIDFFRLVDERGLDLRYKFPVASMDEEEEAWDKAWDKSVKDDSGYYEGDYDEEEEEPEPDWSWITLQDGRVLFGGFDDERTFLEGGASSVSSSASLSPSPSFRLLHERVYFDEAPIEPRLERDFEAEDVEVEEDKEEEDDEPWRRWETEEDVVEADRRWKAFEPFAL